MRKAFTGGACAPGGDGQAMGNNAFTNFLDHMISGGASASQKAEGYGPQMHSAHMGTMEAAFAEQENLSAMNKHFEQMNMDQPPMMQAHAEFHHPAMSKMNDLWDQPLEKIADSRVDAIDSRFSSMPAYSHGMFGLPGMMAPMHHPSSYAQMAHRPQMTGKEEVKVEEIPEEAKQETNQNLHDDMKQVTGEFINDLHSIGSEKIENSQFLSFLKKLNTGAVKVENDGLVEDPVKLQEFEQKEANRRAMDAAYYKAEIDRIVEETKDPERYFKIEDAINQKQFNQDLLNDFDPSSLFKDAWDVGELNEDALQTMMANWKEQAMKSEGYYDETLKEQPVETIIEVTKKDLFKFDEENPYKEVEDAYSLALQLNEELKVHDAILALQAHLTKNPDH
eukprot:CAMPEP_0168319420 /NCGR_PEP_ID=MMETSP0213-20121227/1047_1 /TAXON_ID=151035 /ORGANISM="Euplotes harpa, Strain FSP1.4" /LENGTH=392 /DNA_ID=CAMNT_0008320641 /DNA_START=14 /DNA_END=1192 /DNA_ORIENTATION=-